MSASERLLVCLATVECPKIHGAPAVAYAPRANDQRRRMCLDQLSDLHKAIDRALLRLELFQDDLLSGELSLHMGAYVRAICLLRSVLVRAVGVPALTSRVVPAFGDTLMAAIRAVYWWLLDDIGATRRLTRGEGGGRRSLVAPLIALRHLLDMHDVVNDGDGFGNPAREAVVAIEDALCTIVATRDRLEHLVRTSSTSGNPRSA